MVAHVRTVYVVHSTGLNEYTYRRKTFICFSRQGLRLHEILNICSKREEVKNRNGVYDTMQV